MELLATIFIGLAIGYPAAGILLLVFLLALDGYEIVLRDWREFRSAVFRTYFNVIIGWPWILWRLWR